MEAGVKKAIVKGPTKEFINIEKGWIDRNNPSREIEVYKLKMGSPSADHIWCNFSGCKETFKESDLEFID